MTESTEISRGPGGWQEYFRAGHELKVPYNAQLYARRLRGNTTVMVTLIAIALVFTAWMVFEVATGEGEPAMLAFVLFFDAVMAFAAMRALRVRRQLQVTAASPIYLEISESGLRFAGLVEVPWGQTTGIGVSDARDIWRSMNRRIASWIARKAGVAQVQLVVGVSPGGAISLGAADVRPTLRVLAEVEARGELRIPLDSVLDSVHIERVTLAAQAAAGLETRE